MVKLKSENLIKNCIRLCVILSLLIAATLFTHTEVAHAETMTSLNAAGTRFSDSKGNIYYKGSYERVTVLLPYNSAASTEQKQNAMFNFAPNRNQKLGNIMSTAGFFYNTSGIAPYSVKYHSEDAFGNSSINTRWQAHFILTDGNMVEFRYLGYTTYGDVVTNPFFLSDNHKASSYNGKGMSTYHFIDIKTHKEMPETYKIPSDRDSTQVVSNIDRLDRVGGNSVVTDGYKTQYNLNAEIAKKTFDTWFNTTTVGANYRYYAIQKGYTGETAWQYWNEYIEIDGNIYDGSVSLRLTWANWCYYRTYIIPQEQNSNVIANKIYIYDLGSDELVASTQLENGNYLYADTEIRSPQATLYRGRKYYVKYTFKYATKNSGYTSATPANSAYCRDTSQQCTTSMYYGNSNISARSATTTSTVYGDTRHLTADQAFTSGNLSAYKWTTTEFAGRLLIDISQAQDYGAIGLQVPYLYQENGDNYELCDDELLIYFNIEDQMDMKFTDYNAEKKQPWKQGDTADSTRIWMEDANGNVLKEYKRNELFYICYAYEQSSGKDSISDPAIDTTLYSTSLASQVKSGNKVYSGTLTATGTTLTVNSPPVVYRQPVVVKYEETWKDKSLPGGTLFLDNTNYLNVSANISQKHTQAKENYWITADDTATAHFKASPADMQLNKVTFYDRMENVLKVDVTSTSNKKDSDDTVGYYDREKTFEIRYEIEQSVFENIYIPKPTIYRIIYRGQRNADGTVSKYLDGNGNSVIIRQGTLSSDTPLKYDKKPDYNPVYASESMSTQCEAIYIEYAVADRHYTDLENDINDTWWYMVQNKKPYIATISCTIAEMQVEKSVSLYDSKGNERTFIPHIGETLNFGFSIGHYGVGKEQSWFVGGSIFNPYPTMNIKVIDNDKLPAGTKVTSYNQIPEGNSAIIKTLTGVADSILYSGYNASTGMVPQVRVKSDDVTVNSGNITVCGRIVDAHDANLSNIKRDGNDEYCQTFKAESNLKVEDVSYVPTKSVTGKTDLGLSVTVSSMAGNYTDPDEVLSPVISVQKWNYTTSKWDAVYHQTINIANGTWEVTEIEIPDFEISSNSVRPTLVRVAVNDNTAASTFKYQEYVLAETDSTLHDNPYSDNDQIITVTYRTPDYDSCPTCIGR